MSEFHKAVKGLVESLLDEGCKIYGRIKVEGGKEDVVLFPKTQTLAYEKLEEMDPFFKVHGYSAKFLLEYKSRGYVNRVEVEYIWNEERKRWEVLDCPLFFPHKLRKIQL